MQRLKKTHKLSSAKSCVRNNCVTCTMLHMTLRHTGIQPYRQSDATANLDIPNHQKNRKSIQQTNSDNMWIKQQPPNVVHWDADSAAADAVQWSCWPTSNKIIAPFMGNSRVWAIMFKCGKQKRQEIPTTLGGNTIDNRGASSRVDNVVCYKFLLCVFI